MSNKVVPVYPQNQKRNSWRCHFQNGSQKLIRNLATFQTDLYMNQREEKMLKLTFLEYSMHSMKISIHSKKHILDWFSHRVESIGYMSPRQDVNSFLYTKAMWKAHFSPMDYWDTVSLVYFIIKSNNSWERNVQITIIL